MWTADSNRKICANCANWCGERRAEHGNAIVNSAGDYGKCYCGYHSVNQGTSAWGNNCNERDFVWWGALKHR